MLKRELSKGIVRYVFDPLPDRHFGNSITTLVDGNRVVLIDTAYEFQALQVLDDISRDGLEIDSIIISHFHDDHMNGLKMLPKVRTYGSEYYKATLDMWKDKEEHKYFTPTELIKEPRTIEFGRHEIRLIPFPGHSQCTLLTQVDNKYLHIADELMFSNEGRPILPSTDPNCINRHIDSLERLKAYEALVFMPGHGLECILGTELENDINNRIAYFSRILSSDGEITYQEAIKDCDCEFLHSEWHRFVYEQ